MGQGGLGDYYGLESLRNYKRDGGDPQSRHQNYVKGGGGIGARMRGRGFNSTDIIPPICHTRPEINMKHTILLYATSIP